MTKIEWLELTKDRIIEEDWERAIKYINEVIELIRLDGEE